MKKLIQLLVLFLLCGCVQQPAQEIEPIDKTMKEKMIQLTALGYGPWIEHYRSVIPKDKNQEIIKDNITKEIYEKNEISLQKIVLKGFENEQIDELNQTFDELYQEGLTQVEYEGNSIKTAPIITYEIYENDQVISIIQTKGVILEDHTTSDFTYQIWNLDRNTGKIYKNEELILDYEALTQTLQNELSKQNIEVDYEVNDQSLYYQKENAFYVKIKTSSAQQYIDIKL